MNMAEIIAFALKNAVTQLQWVKPVGEAWVLKGINLVGEVRFYIESAQGTVDFKKAYVSQTAAFEAAVVVIQTIQDDPNGQIAPPGLSPRTPSFLI